MFFTDLQCKNIIFSENFCSENFSHILGRLKIVVFQNDVFGPSKILFYQDQLVKLEKFTDFRCPRRRQKLVKLKKMAPNPKVGSHTPIFFFMI